MRRSSSSSPPSISGWRRRAPGPARGLHHVHLNSSIGSAKEVVASVTRLNWTMKSAAVEASGASKITIASGFPRRPRNSCTMTLFGSFGCLNRRVASSNWPGRIRSCVTKSMAARGLHHESAIYNRAAEVIVRSASGSQTNVPGRGSGGTGPRSSRGRCRTIAAADPRRRRAPRAYRGAGRRTRRASGCSGRPPSRRSSDLGAHDELPDRRADDCLEEGRVEEQEDAPEDAVHPGSPDVLDIQEGPEGREHRGEVDDVCEDPLDPVDLESPIVTDEVEAAHHERIPPFPLASRY